jgi:hypothetical protein
MYTQSRVTQAGSANMTKCLTSYYHKLDAGTIQKNHVFSVNQDDDTIIMESSDHMDDDVVVPQGLLT